MSLNLGGVSVDVFSASHLCHCLFVTLRLDGIDAIIVCPLLAHALFILFHLMHCQLSLEPYRIAVWSFAQPTRLSSLFGRLPTTYIHPFFHCTLSVPLAH